MRVELVSCDWSWSRSIFEGFRNATGCHVEVARDGSDGLRLFATMSPDVVVVDSLLQSPGLNAIQVCRAIRALSSAVGLVMVADRNAVEDKLSAFDLGVDDCLVRSVDLREMQARLKALVRRASLLQTNSVPSARNVLAGEHRLVHECLVVDLISQIVTVDGIGVDLSKRQFLLLVYLIRHAGHVVRERELREHVLGVASSVNRNSTVRNHIHALRHKLGRPGQLIISVPGVGYKLPTR